MNKALQTRLFSLSVFVLISIIGYLVFSPAFNGGFIFDDTSNLFSLSIFHDRTGIDKYIDYLLSYHSGLLKRPITTLSFLLNAQDWPADPFYFKVTNFIIHMINGVLLYFATSAILKLIKPELKSVSLIALFSSLIWFFHPFFISTVFYIVQRMAMLTVTFTLFGIIFYCKGRTLLSFNTRKSIIYMIIGVYVFTALATLSKENGILLPFLLIILEALIVKNSNKKTLNTKLFSILFYLPITVIVIALIYKMPGLLDAYKHREFTLLERLFSEARAICTYLYHIFAPTYFTEGVFTDGFKTSTSLFSPRSTFYSLIFIVSTIAFSLKYFNKYPIVSFAILFFYTAHFLESTFIPLELYFEHRNYLPALFLPLPISYLLVYLYRKKTIFLVIPFLLISFLSFNSFLRSKLWGNNLNLHIQSSIKFPESVRASTISADLLAKKDLPGDAMNILTKSFETNKNIELLLNLLNLKCFTGLLNDQDFKQLRELLVSSKFTIADSLPFNNSINILLENKCLIKTRHLVPEILKLVEKNKGFERDIIKHYLYYNYAKYYATMRINDKAINYTRTIILDSKNVPVFTLTSDIIEIFISNEEYSAANKTLDMLQIYVNKYNDERDVFLIQEKIKNYYIEANK